MMTTDRFSPAAGTLRVIVAMLAVMAAHGDAYAQATGAAVPRVNLLRALSVAAAEAGVVAEVAPAPLAQPAARRGRRSVRRMILGGAAGAVGGFFAGGFTGAWIEGDRCNCDDPGFKGFLIGAPVGSVLGGVVGAKFLF